MLGFHEKILVAQFLTSKMTRKMARNRMNENSENWQCAMAPNFRRSSIDMMFVFSNVAKKSKDKLPF